MKKLLIAVLLPLALTACGKDDKPDSPKPDQGTLETLNEDGVTAQAAVVITVADEAGTPLKGAKVLIGWSKDKPFAGNFLVTDANGQVTSPEAWTEPLPITAQAAGFVRLTFLEQAPKAVTLKLRRVNKEPKIELSGLTTGHTVANGDGQTDFGLVMSALTRNDMLAFDLNKVISTQMDQISAIGQKIDIPSNITLPEQRENYILPITLNKPAYRLYFGDKGQHRVYAAQGRFPFKTVIDEVRSDKKFYELINHFSITGGVIRDVRLTADRSRLDLPVTELKFDEKRAMKAPAIRADEVLIALAAADMSGWLVPTDVKKLASNETMNMSVMKSRTSFAIGVLKRSNEFEAGPGQDRLSATILPFTAGVKPAMLPLINNPRIASNGDLLLPKPSTISGVKELATYTIFSEVKEIPVGTDGKMPFLARIWEVYAPDWVDTMTLPKWPDGTPAPAAKRWEVSYIGSNKTASVELGQPVIEAATHVTHSSLDH